MTKIEAATAWLKTFMDEKSQGGQYAVYAKTILTEGAKAGFEPNTIRRAYRSLHGVRPKKNGMAGWSWRLSPSKSVTFEDSVLYRGSNTPSSV